MAMIFQATWSLFELGSNKRVPWLERQLLRSIVYISSYQFVVCSTSITTKARQPSCWLPSLLFGRLYSYQRLARGYKSQQLGKHTRTPYSNANSPTA
eukprot:scaffold34712_cov18-Prasinocladus_malaysianus.AAC.1